MPPSNNDDFDVFGPDDEPNEETAPIPVPQLGERIALRARRRRRIVMWLKIFAFTATLFLVVALIGVIGAWFYAKPRYDLAQSFDLSKLEELEVASRIFDRNGKEMGRIFVQNRRPVTLDEVSVNFVNALLAAEDSRYYEHDGVDYIGVMRAVYQALKDNEFTQGASTITQQLARNAFELDERTISRKITEMFLARRMEAEIGSKQRILEMYMNRIYFGSGYYGIAAAAEGYFGKNPRHLSLSEAATLAGVIRNPYYRSPRNFPDAAKTTRDSVLARMMHTGYIDDDELRRASQVPIRTVEKGNITGKSAFVYEEVRQEVIRLLGYEEVSSGGLQIHTTIDVDVQEQAEKALVERLREVEQRPDYKHETQVEYKAAKKVFEENANQEERFRNPDYLQGALLMVENRTGGVIAQVGSRDFSDSMFDRATQGRRPTGTAFLPFVYAAAFENGMYPGTQVDDAPMDTRQVMIGGTTGILGEWGSESFDNTYEGRITARRALAASKNSATVSLGQRVGLKNVVQLARGAGLDLKGELTKFNATFLGRNPSSLVEMCLAYSVFPNKGRGIEKTHIIADIRDKQGNVIYSPSTGGPGEEVVDPFTAHQVSSILSDVFEYGTGAEAREEYGLGDYPVAGKTGTEYNFTDNWFVGYTTEVTCGVWAGFDQKRTIYPGAFSRNTVLPIWTSAMNAAAGKFEPKPFLPPPDAEQVEICHRSGELASDDCYELRRNASGVTSQVRTTYTEYVRPGTRIGRLCHIHSKGGRALDLTEQYEPKPGEPLRPRPVIIASAKPVIPIGPTLIAIDDPYKAVTPVLRARVSPVGGSEEEESGEEGGDGGEEEKSGDEEAQEDPVAVDPNGIPVARPIIDLDSEEPEARERVRLASPQAIEFDE